MGTTLGMGVTPGIGVFMRSGPVLLLVAIGAGGIETITAAAGGAAPGTGMLLRSGAWLLLVATTVVVGVEAVGPGMGMLDRSGAWLLGTAAGVATAEGAAMGVGATIGFIGVIGTLMLDPIAALRPALALGFALTDTAPKSACDGCADICPARSAGVRGFTPMMLPAGVRGFVGVGTAPEGGTETTGAATGERIDAVEGLRMPGLVLWWAIEDAVEAAPTIAAWEGEVAARGLGVPAGGTPDGGEASEAGLISEPDMSETPALGGTLGAAASAAPAIGGTESECVAGEWRGRTPPPAGVGGAVPLAAGTEADVLVRFTEVPSAFGLYSGAAEVTPGSGGVRAPDAGVAGVRSTGAFGFTIEGGALGFTRGTAITLGAAAGVGETVVCVVA